MRCEAATAHATVKAKAMLIYHCDSAGRCTAIGNETRSEIA